MKDEVPGNVIEAKGLGYRYQAEAPFAVKDVDLKARSGEFIAILGRNGSGKSTLAKLINALYLPSEGEVFVLGMNTKDEALTFDIRSKAGMIFQNPDNQLVATVVEEDVAFGPENMGVPPVEIRKRVDDALASVRMGDFAHKEPHRLSGGQKQRVAIAGVLAMQPKILLCDEVTAMLDPLGRREVLSAVDKLCREDGITILWITHFMEETIKADRLIIMDQSEILMEGTPREIFQQVEKIKSIGLDVPAPTEIAHMLRGMGHDIPGDILTDEELVEAVCRFV